MKITIDNRDLAYTIDTYGMFTGESVDEMESEHYRENYKLTDDEWTTIGFNYDHKDIVKDLAEFSIDVVTDGLTDYIVKSVTLLETGSPQFYNYTTDWYTAEWDIDEVQLTKYIANRQSKYTEWVMESEWDLERRKSDEQYNLLAMLDYYTINTLDLDSYNEAMWEHEPEIYFEHMQLDEESQLLINSKESI